jgi:hypothetical protein
MPKNTTKNQLWYNTPRIFGCSDSIRIPIYLYAWSTARRFLTNLKLPLSETDEKDLNPKTIDTTRISIPKVSIKLGKNKNFGSRFNMEGTTSDELTKFIHAIQKCWDEKSYKFKNLYQVAFAEETLQIAYKEILKKKKTLTSEGDVEQKLNKTNLNTLKNISDRLFNSCYKFEVSKKDITKKYPFTIMSS